jgi:NAD(P)-dependent dehydrogenase (short-subunit alcohol dehydrogenase family)
LASSVDTKAPGAAPVQPGQLPGKKVAIVTGASKGIGAGIAAAFSAAGYAVVGTARSVEPSDTPDVLMLPGDIVRAETAELVVQQGLVRFGRIDTLVNNAGIFIGKPFTEYTVDDYVAITSVNLTGFFHVTQRAIRQMVAQGGGHVVNVSTSLVDHADSRTPSALASLTKGGLEAVTRSLATEYAKRGVRVNAVSLGIIKTPLHDPASYEELASRHPLGRVGEVDDVVGGILYLERATFVTGETLHIDGGRAAGD